MIHEADCSMMRSYMSTRLLVLAIVVTNVPLCRSVCICSVLRALNGGDLDLALSSGQDLFF